VRLSGGPFGVKRLKFLVCEEQERGPEFVATFDVLAYHPMIGQGGDLAR
jgi:hypothetical protein